MKAEPIFTRYHNGRIWTGEPPDSRPSGVTIRDGVIEGLDGESSCAADGSSVRLVDLGGGFVTPGLVDAHGHVMALGQALERVELQGTESLEEAQERIRRHRERFPSAPGQWLRGRGWDENRWQPSRTPAGQDLDTVCSDIPACLNRVDGHAVWVNSLAMTLTGIDAGTPDPPGGKIHRDSTGKPTGVLVDRAVELVTRHIPGPDPEDRVRVLRRAMRALARTGLTGVHDMGMGAADLAVFREASGSLALRVYGSFHFDDPDLSEVLRAAPDPPGNGRFRLGMVKFFTDGALGSRGAALLSPYADAPGETGLLLLDPKRLEEGMAAVLEAGFQCAIHAIGDRANRMVLDAVDVLRPRLDPGSSGWARPAAPDTLLGSRPAALPPVRLEHAQILHPEDIPRVGELGVVASVQPAHFTSDAPWAHRFLGTERLAGAYPWRSLLRGGAVLAIGSDFPIEPADPLRGLWAAVTREVPGETAAAWKRGGHPDREETLTPEEALVAVTAGPAYVSGDLHRRGTLSVGKDADFVVWDRDLTRNPEALRRARPLLVVVGGRTIWADRGVFPGEAVPEED